jgi:Universal stress protein family
MMHVGLGDCERELVQFAIDYEADLLVVGTHDRGRLAALLSPSLAGALAHGAPCPVLVARPRGYEGLSKSPSIEPPLFGVWRPFSATTEGAPDAAPGPTRASRADARRRPDEPRLDGLILTARS